MNKRQIKAMGTLIQLSINHDDAEYLFDFAEAKIRAWEQRFSANNTQSELMAINQQAGIRPVQVHPELFHLIKKAHQASMSSNLKLNILIGPLVKLWRIGFEDAQLPTNTEIQQRLRRIQPHHLYLNDAKHEIFLAQHGMEIDLGAIAKGYFADELQAFFLQNGVTSGIINLGGNVITIGSPATHKTWHVGIRDPFHHDGLPLLTVEIQQQSVVTSGIYERYFYQDGQLYHHILDSTTGYPANNDIASVTIISNHSIDGEIWSTLCSFGYAQQNIDLLNQIDGVEGVIIRKNHDILFTHQLRTKLHL
ncbi:FAD:protein FMN transferase [Staphylococcus lugdunensis]|uniref:FAD:protein FMN transferase n=1 Tax=Staphylococcus lugdunensis TaxID=28035 RepID=UPI000A1091C3|nr:thiamine biosynthesis protein ApbE [Staphylococcus lugdunensis]